MKILEYAKNIRLEMLEYVAKIVIDYKENEWHNAPEGFCLHSYNDAIEATILASRTIPIHNANGYQGDVHQFLWRQNMDYHQLLTSEPQPMQQPATTDYAAQLATIKTLPELFDFRSKLKSFLKAEIQDYFGCEVKTEPERVQAERISELEFFIDRVESQIKSLGNNGVFLAAVDGRGAVAGLDFSSGQSTQVDKTTWSVSGSGLSPIEQKANKCGLLKKLRALQGIVNECQWAYADSEFSVLYDWGLVVKLSICDSSEYAYMWRNDMDYENFFQIKNPPKN